MNTAPHTVSVIFLTLLRCVSVSSVVNSVPGGELSALRILIVSFLWPITEFPSLKMSTLPHLPKDNLRFVSGVVSVLMGCNKDLTANSWGRKYKDRTSGQTECYGEGE